MRGGCELRALFEESGAALTVILVPDAPEEGEEAEQLLKGAEDLANLLAMPGEIEAKELIAGGLLLPEAEAAVLQRPPDCCLLLLKPEAFSSGNFFYELWQELQEKGIQVIALFAWAEGESFRYPDELETGFSLVDNIDTFWGQVALHFHPRCRYKQDICSREAPRLESLDGIGHFVACHLRDELNLTGIPMGNGR